MAVIQLTNSGSEGANSNSVDKQKLVNGTQDRLRKPTDIGTGARSIPLGGNGYNYSQNTPGSLNEGSILLSGARTLDFQAAERFRILRARIERQNLDKDNYHVLTVTSAVPEEGKSLVSVNLARALATDSRGKTLIIDADLRRPSVHRYFGIKHNPGLSDALVSGQSIDRVIQSVEPGLDVITAGTPVVDAARAIELPSLARHVHELKRRYRYIIIDCPPVLLCPEPLTLSSLADATLMVVRAWRTQKKLVKDAVNLIGKERFLGIIVNDGQDTLNEYGYYGYYGYDNRNPKNRSQAANTDNVENVKRANANGSICLKDVCNFVAKSFKQGENAVRPYLKKAVAKQASFARGEQVRAVTPRKAQASTAGFSIPVGARAFGK